MHEGFINGVSSGTQESGVLDCVDLLYLRSMENIQEECPFCGFVDTKGQKVYETDEVYAIVSEHPINRYHVLIIPQNHFRSLVDLPENVVDEVMKAVQILSMAVRKAAKADAMTHVTEDDVTGKGYNTVSHFKFHIIPRYEEDIHLMNWQPLRIEVSDEEIRQLAEEIKSLI